MKADFCSTEELKRRAIAAAGVQLAARRRGLSLVDCASFEVMRRTGLRAAFAFDPHFEKFGYELIA